MLTQDKPLMDLSSMRVAVVIPAYKVTNHILSVLAGLPAWISKVYVVDDACPHGSGGLVRSSVADARVTVLNLERNLGVGGAVMAGYSAALSDQCEIIVKVDGDGQMDPDLIEHFVVPIALGEADYTKGNRFYNPDDVREMPRLRLVGNAALSFMSKVSTGYWDIFDPTNGFTAISSRVARELPFDKISSRYFFETDVLFRLGGLRAVVADIPMKAKYGDEVSNLEITKVLGEFAAKHALNTVKRTYYTYFLREVNIGTVQLVAGLSALLFSLTYGSIKWWSSVDSGVPAATGTVMLAAIPLVLGTQMLIGFIAADLSMVPRRAIWPLLGRRATSD